MNLKVELEGLDILLAQFNPERISKQLAQGIASATNVLETEIERSVVNYYSISATEVNKRIQKKSISLQKQGKNIITGGLVYTYKAKPLSSFPLRETTVSVKSRFLIPRGNGFKFIKRQTAKSVAVAVRRGSYKTVVGKKGFGGYLQKAGRSKWATVQGGRVSSFHRGIYERQQDATWITEPVDRAPVKPLFGPAVTDMVDNRLDSDGFLKDTLDNFDLLLGKFITL